MAQVRLKSGGVSVPDEIYVIQNGVIVNDFTVLDVEMTSFMLEPSTLGITLYGFNLGGNGELFYPFKIKGKYPLNKFSEFYIQMYGSYYLKSGYTRYQASTGINSVVLGSLSMDTYESGYWRWFGGGEATLNISELIDNPILFWRTGYGVSNGRQFGIRNLKLIK